MLLPYRLFDVFTQHPLHGNPLAIVDARKVEPAASPDEETQQRVAREFNLSETVFLLPAADEPHTVALTIYTPERALPFAGHPTIGAAIAVAHDILAESLATGLILMEEPIGLIRAAVSVPPTKSDRHMGYAEFDLPSLPRERAWSAQKEDIALALGLPPADIGFENHVPSQFDGGLPYFCVPVRNLEVLNAIIPQSDLFMDVFDGGRGHDSAYIYTRETVSASAAFAGRMIWPVGGALREDPATGSGVAALAGAIMKFDGPMEGQHRLRIEQGFAMGRPSQIELELDVDVSGALRVARLGGHAVCIAQGELCL